MRVGAACLVILWAVVTPLVGAAQETSPSKGEDKLVVTTPAQADLTWAPCGHGLPEGCELAVLRGNPTIGPVEMFVRVPKSYSFPFHWHTSAARMTWFQGKGTVRSVEGQEMPITPVAYIYIPDKMMHAARCGAEESCLFSVYFDQAFDVFPEGEKK